jgi:hypothetical protein
MTRMSPLEWIRVVFNRFAMDSHPIASAASSRIENSGKWPQAGAGVESVGRVPR